MATYVIGDIQGCHAALMSLIEQIAFDPAHDRLWFVGDLVNRGPDSLATLRYVKSLGDRAVCVLGNHDLHLLTVAAGFARAHRGDTIGDILAADDREELLHWLRHRPMVHVDQGVLMVHAGLLPQWTVDQALSLAAEVESALQDDAHLDFLASMYGNEPARWDPDLRGFDRLRVIVNAMTRMRVLRPDGSMDMAFKSGLEFLPAGLVPWYEAPGRATRNTTIAFGHWSALGLRLEGNLLALDTGCLWGGCLSAVRLRDRALFQVSCAGLAGTTSWK